MINVLQVYDSIAVSSGISSVLMEWMRNMKNYNTIKMDFLCCWNKNPSYEEEILKNNSLVYYIEKGENIENYYNFIKKVETFMREKADRYNIIHLHSSIFSFPILFYAKKYGIKTRIVHVHSASLGNTKFSNFRNKFLILPMKACANYYWACSEEAAKEWFDPYKIKNYEIIYNGIDIKKFTVDSQNRITYRKLWNIKDDEVLLGHISNMSPIKNVPFILQVLHHLLRVGYKVKLALIGKNELPEEVQKYIKKYNLNEYIVNVGVSNEIEKCIQAFDIGVMPSVSEGYGLVPIELQAAHVPVIMSNGFPKIIEITELAARVELLEDVWVRKIIEIIDNKRQYDFQNIDKRMQKYDVEKVVDRIIKLYSSYV